MSLKGEITTEFDDAEGVLFLLEIGELGPIKKLHLETANIKGTRTYCFEITKQQFPKLSPQWGRFIWSLKDDESKRTSQEHEADVQPPGPAS